MTCPGALPVDEIERLRRLYALQVLDTEPEAIFDALARAAAAMCDAPIALLSLVDARRQWFKANVGLPQTSETDRDVAFCSHAILSPDVMQVPDALLDPRFADNPLVTTGPAIRFYAGAPLVLTDGAPLGTLCVLDRQPRRLTDAQLLTLQHLAAAASQALEFRQRTISSVSKYRDLVDRQSEIISVATPDGVLTFVNQAYARLYDRTATEMIGMNFFDFIADAQREAVADHLKRVCEHKITASGENDVITAKGQRRWLQWTNQPVLDEHDRVVAIHSVGRDITERRQAEIALRASQQALAESREQLQVTLESIGDAVITTGNDGNVKWLNPVAERLTGWSKAEVVGSPLSQVFKIIDEDTRHVLADPVLACLASQAGLNTDKQTHRALLVARDGSTFDIEENVAPIRNQHGQVLGAVLVFRDVSEQRRLTREMRHRATHDSLTRLPNRTEFEATLGHLLARSRGDGSRHAMLFIDLDWFKQVNDRCGHAAGDQLLREVSDALRAGVREQDTVARLGGDEFGVLLMHCDDRHAYYLAQRLCQTLADLPFTVNGHRPTIGASIGLVPIDARWTNGAEASKAADNACYSAKASGRNQVHVGFRLGVEVASPTLTPKAKAPA